MSAQLPSPETVNVKGLSIRLIRGGRSEGTPVLLTSPWPESIYAFRLTWEHFADLGPLIAVDLPGFGRSEANASFLTPSGMSDFIIALLGVLGIERCHAIGPDIGTAAFLFAAAKAPELFSSITVGSGGTDMGLVGESLRNIIEGPEAALDIGIDANPIVEVIRELSAVQPSPDVMEDYRLSSADGRYKEAAAYVRAYPQELPLLAELAPRITTPCLVLSGRYDPLVPPENGALLERILPNCRHHILETGHFVWEDDPEQYARLASDWIRSNGQTH